ncbi:MAG: transglutaminaseTgpA domain-containing protein [Nocardioides sp.]
MTVDEATRPSLAPPRRPSAPWGERLAGRLRGGGTTAILGLSAAAAGTTWLAMFSWRGFTTQSALFLGPLFLLALVIAGLGAALRLARLPAVAILAIQAVAGFLSAQAVITGYGLPTPTALADLGNRWSGALESSRLYAAPVPASAADGVEPLLILGGLACLLLVDLLACSLQRVPLAGLPLLTIYTIPVSLTGEGVSWWVFAAIAGGFVLMLFLQESEHLSRWGRTLGQDDAVNDPSGFSVRTGDIRTSAAGIAGLATAVALVLPVLIPTLTLELFAGGFGPGKGDDLRIVNPMTDLRRDLRRGADIPLMRITTADPNPSYLRVAVLTRLGDEEWSSGDRTVPQSNIAQGELPALEGVSVDVERRPFNYQVQAAEEFDSIWLPTAQNLSEIYADGSWRYDTRTMDFLAGDDDLSTSNLAYTFTKVDLDLSAPEMARAPAALSSVGAEFTALPSDLSPQVRTLARQVTDGFPNRYQRAVALQEWFRDPGNFTYSLEVPEGNGAGDLVSFLTEGPEGRIGYCEQFASAMAVMARTLDIPARVAVGFLSPDPLGPNRWEFSAHDMHAWPELYFPGSGWVRFEPTPAGGPTGVLTNTPDYTQEELPTFAPPSDQPSNAQPSADLPTRGGDAASADPNAGADSSSGGAGLGTTARRALIGIGVVALLLGLAHLPQLLRRLRRDRRWRTGGVPAAWAELHDTATDLGITWRPGLSPRAMRGRLVEHFGAPLDAATPERPVRGSSVAPEAVAALDRIVHEVELLRYARHPGTADDRGLRFDTGLCVAALNGGASRSARRRAKWWPRSLFRRAAPRATPIETEQATRGVIVDHVG